jgi:hypothetical protein
MFRRTANPRIKPRKPLVFFIVGLFRAAIKKHKRFSKYGDSSHKTFLPFQGFFDDPIPCQKCFVKVVENVEK